ncbi:MAG: transglutaminase-like cysteine peptidase [Rhodospirillaceae bacterium]|nr:transglutaminase-like cysteine peptidase [Rhodospirillaceae bacterium]
MNAYINWQFTADIDNYGSYLITNTPREFFARGGDCEDYAIANIFRLGRSAGFRRKALRVAVIEDRARNLVHSVLIAYHEGRALVLDIEIETVTDQRRIDRHAPILSPSPKRLVVLPLRAPHRQRRAHRGRDRARSRTHRRRRPGAGEEGGARGAAGFRQAGRRQAEAPSPLAGQVAAGRSRRAAAEDGEGSPADPVAATHGAKPREATLASWCPKSPNEAQSVQIDPGAPPAPGERMEQVFLPGAR